VILLDYNGCRYPEVPLMALTATATPRVQHDVVQQLCLRKCVIFRSSFNRANLRWADLLLSAMLSHNNFAGYDQTSANRLP
jgi:superfamily II DNA helicase RecQ